MHAAALQAWAGQPPLDVAVFIEGEEETGSTHLPRFLSTYEELLQADAIVIADCSNWTIGQPTLITSLRGLSTAWSRCARSITPCTAASTAARCPTRSPRCAG